MNKSKPNRIGPIAPVLKIPYNTFAIGMIGFTPNITQIRAENICLILCVQLRASILSMWEVNQKE